MDTSPSGSGNGEAALLSDARQINLLIVIDTEYLRNYLKTSNITPSQDKDHPTRMPADRTGQYMICTGSRAPVEKQGTGYIKFTAHTGDTVALYGESADANSEDAVIVYRIVLASGSIDVFNHFHVEVVDRTGAVFPNADTADGLPARHAPASFTTLNGTVRHAGVETFYVHFALYGLDENGEEQKLFGYFDCDPVITVQ